MADPGSAKLVRRRIAAEVSIRGIVLRRRNLGDADRIVSIFSSTLGLIDAVVKGSRRPKAKLAGVSEPLTSANFQLAQGKSLYTVTQAQVHTSFPRLRSDYERLSIALAICELYCACNPEGLVTEFAFELLETALQQLEVSGSPSAVFVWTALKLLELEGLAPSWIVCAISGTPLGENPAYVSASGGGYVCLAESTMYEDRFTAPAEALIGLSKTAALTEPPTRLKEADACLEILYAFWLNGAHRPLPGFAAMLQASKLSS